MQVFLTTLSQATHTQPKKPKQEDKDTSTDTGKRTHDYAEDTHMPRQKKLPNDEEAEVPNPDDDSEDSAMEE